MDPTPLVDTSAEELLRSPVAQAPLSVILLALGSSPEAVEGLAAWKSHLATLEREFHFVLIRPHSLPVDGETESIEYDLSKGYGHVLRTAISDAEFPLVLL